jgi:hypothetical protein
MRQATIDRELARAVRMQVQVMREFLWRIGWLYGKCVFARSSQRVQP